MKKKILGGIVAVAIAAVAAVNVNFNSEADALSSLSLANIEALADGESGGGNYRWHNNRCSDGTQYECCTTNGNGNSCSSPGSCTRNCN